MKINAEETVDGKIMETVIEAGERVTREKLMPGNSGETVTIGDKIEVRTGDDIALALFERGVLSLNIARCRTFADLSFGQRLMTQIETLLRVVDHEHQEQRRK